MPTGPSLLNEVFRFDEIALTGNSAQQLKKKLALAQLLNKNYIGRNKFFTSLLKDEQSIETKIYICRNKACQLPVTTVEEALKLNN